MANLDVKVVDSELIEIISSNGDMHGLVSWLDKKFLGGAYVSSIDDGERGLIVVKNKEHAQNLIKALNKAIELGWLK